MKQNKMKLESKQTSQILSKLKNLPVNLVEIKIVQSILSSKIVSMDKNAIEKLINTIIHHIKNVFDKSFDDIQICAYRIDIIKDDYFSFDYIQHRFVIIGKGFEKKIHLLKEKIKSYVKMKMGDNCSLIIREDQESPELYTYFFQQPPNSTNKEHFVSDKMLKFYHPDLYELSERGWAIFNPNQIKNSFILFQ
jgi:hypothetical protein